MKEALILFIWAICFSISGFSQTSLEINFNQIREFINNHPNEFEALLKRYETNDSTLTEKDYALIYFGYSFTPAYKGSMDNYKNFNQLMKDQKNEEAYQWGKEYLKTNPVSLKLLHDMYTLSGQLNNTKDETNGYILKYLQLLNMIAQTGNGQSENTAFKVICVNDEYHLMEVYWKVDEILSQSLIKNYDVIEIGSGSKYDGNKIYFDISRLIEYMNGLFK